MDLLEKYIKKDEIDWHLHLRYSLVDNNIPKKIKKKLDFMCDKLDFFYGDNLYQKNPFQPMVVWNDGRRSSVVEDLKIEDIEEIKDLKNYTHDPIILGKLKDVLWILENNESDGLELSNIYFNYFLDNRLTKEYSQTIPPLKRSLYILCVLKKDNILKQHVDTIFNFRKYKNTDDKHILLYYIATCLEKNRKSILSYYIKKIEKVIDGCELYDECTLTLIEIVIKYYKSSNNSKKIEKWLLQYVKVCEEIEKIQSPHGHEYLTKAINILDDNNHEELINDLMIKRDESQKKMHDSFKMQEITLDTREIDKKINEVRDKIISDLKKLNSVQQFILLLKEFNPVSESNIKKQISKNKKSSVLSDLFPKVIFGKDKTIVYDESKANFQEKQEYEYADQYNMYMPLTYSLIVQPYMANSIVDNDLETIIKEIIQHNLFVPKDRIEKVTEDILNILNKKIRLGLFDLITQFEKGCRFYLKNTKNLYPVVKHGSKYDKTNLNDMLIKKQKDNKFRDAICEIVEKDLVLELEYLLCRPLSANIRNRYVHDGCGNYNEFTIDEAILSFLLIKAYCLGYDSEINKKTTN